MNLPAREQAFIEKLTKSLREALGENLYSLVLYGSAVRGDFVAGVSDFNLLVVLKASTAEAHAALGELLIGPVRVEPLIVGLDALERTMKAFPSKFLSIRRHSEVLSGSDPFQSVSPVGLDKFLIEESLRNIRLRVVYNYVKWARDPKKYGEYLLDVLPSFFTVISDALRVEGQDPPGGFAERVPLFEKAFSTDAAVLSDLVALKTSPRRWDKKEVLAFHARVCRLFDDILQWVERTWPTR